MKPGQMSSDGARKKVTHIPPGLLSKMVPLSHRGCWRRGTQGSGGKGVLYNSAWKTIKVRKRGREEGRRAASAAVSRHVPSSQNDDGGWMVKDRRRKRGGENKWNSPVSMPPLPSFSPRQFIRDKPTAEEERALKKKEVPRNGSSALEYITAAFHFSAKMWKGGGECF